jgi:2-phosphosulfolactate phosphatase
MIARANADYILNQAPAVVSIVAMGERSQAKAPEDEACGDYLEALLTGQPYDHVGALSMILASATAGKFLRNDKPYLPPADPPFCLQRDLFEFALRAEPRPDGVESIRVDSGA